MKKIYSALLSVSLCAFSMSAASAAFHLTAANDAATLLEPVRVNHELSSLKDKSTTDYQPSTTVSQPAKAPASGTWESIGTGTWSEGLLDMFNDVPSGLKWEVTIEENSETPGWYRICPYGSTNPITEIIGATDPETYVYINATNPEKVYVEPFTSFGSFLFAQLVPESEMFGNAYSMYGTLEENVISFPAQSFAYIEGQSAYYANTEGGFRIALPGGVLKDYSITAYTPFCTEDNQIEIAIQRGADVATLKAMITQGYYTTAGNNANVVAKNGQEIPAANNGIAFNANNSIGINSVLLVALDEKGNIQTSTQAQFFGLDDDADNWKDVGEGTFNESLYSSLYKNFTEEILTVAIQEHKTEAGRYRLVNPYAKSTQIPADALLDCKGHNHYIFINATNPAQVYVEASPLGVAVSGEGAVYSWAGRYLAANVPADEIAAEGLFGKMENGVITMPEGSLMLAEKLWDNGSFLAAGSNFKVTVPTGSVESIVNDADANAPVEYFNLQGIRLTNPEAGQLVIKRQGSTVTKMIAR